MIITKVYAEAQITYIKFIGVRNLHGLKITDYHCIRKKEALSVSICQPKISDETVLYLYTGLK